MNLVAARLRWFAAICRYFASCPGSMSMLMLGILFTPIALDCAYYDKHMVCCVSRQFFDANGNAVVKLSDGAAHRAAAPSDSCLSDGELNLNLK